MTRLQVCFSDVAVADILEQFDWYDAHAGQMRLFGQQRIRGLADFVIFNHLTCAMSGESRSRDFRNTWFCIVSAKANS